MIDPFERTALRRRDRDEHDMRCQNRPWPGATLVTSNERDFRDIPGLTVENWLAEAGSAFSPPFALALPPHFHYIAPVR